MSPQVVIAAVKAVVAILTDKKLRNFVFGIILGGIIIICIPIFTILAIFNEAQNLDFDEIGEMVIAQLDDEQREKLEHINDLMISIESAMTDAGYSGTRISEAQVLFTLALYDHSYESGFVDKLVGCFAQGQTDAQLVATVNSAFIVDISTEDFSNMMKSIRAVYIDSSGFVSPETKNNLDLVQWAKNAEHKNWGYVWGTYGHILDSEQLTGKIEQYPDNVGIYEEFIRNNWLDGRTADCIGLIKGYCWYDTQTGKIDYAVNGMPDIDANYMANSVAEKGTIETIPEIPGLAVWHSGHIGIYIGDGKVVEAKATRIGVVETNLSDGSWTHWIKIPYITYMEDPSDADGTTPLPSTNS